MLFPISPAILLRCYRLPNAAGRIAIPEFSKGPEVGAQNNLVEHSYGSHVPCSEESVPEMEMLHSKTVKNYPRVGCLFQVRRVNQHVYDFSCGKRYMKA
jgi:hypothetical protein